MKRKVQKKISSRLKENLRKIKRKNQSEGKSKKKWERELKETKNSSEKRVLRDLRNIGWVKKSLALGNKGETCFYIKENGRTMKIELALYAWIVHFLRYIMHNIKATKFLRVVTIKRSF